MQLQKLLNRKPRVKSLELQANRHVPQQGQIKYKPHAEPSQPTRPQPGQTQPCASRPSRGLVHRIHWSFLKQVLVVSFRTLGNRQRESQETACLQTPSPYLLTTTQLERLMQPEPALTYKGPPDLKSLNLISRPSTNLPKPWPTKSLSPTREAPLTHLHWSQVQSKTVMLRSLTLKVVLNQLKLTTKSKISKQKAEKPN